VRTQIKNYRRFENDDFDALFSCDLLYFLG